MISEEILEYHYGEIANKLDEMIPVEWKKIVMQAIDFGTSATVYFYFYTFLFLDDYNLSFLDLFSF